MISSNPIYALIYLIGIYIQVAFILININNIFGFIYILVYVGAILMIFLFVIMILNIHFIDLLSNNNNLFIIFQYISIIIFFTVFYIYFFNADFNLNYFVDFYNNFDISYHFDYNFVLTIIGFVIFTKFPFIICIIGFILFLSVLAAIIITTLFKIPLFIKIII